MTATDADAGTIVLTAPSRDALAGLAARSRAESSVARGMPAHLYGASDILALEMERIFGSEWACPGQAADIPKPGDFVTFSIGRHPILTIRGQDGIVRSFANVCRHRMMRLLEGRGHCRRIVCPYHAWTYDLTGRLVGASQMQRSGDFDRDRVRLRELRTELWQGWIYVTLDDDAESVSGRLGALAPITARYGMEHYAPVIQQDQTWETNWKLLCENFLEGYHADSLHRRTVGAGFDALSTTFPERAHDHFTYHLFEKGEEARYGRAHSANTRLQGAWRGRSVLAFVYPAHLFSLAPDYLWYLSLRPDGPSRVQVRFGVAVAPEVLEATTDVDNLAGRLLEFFDRANGEDREVVEAVYRSALSPDADNGALCWLERSIHDFMGYLARRLAPRNSDCDA